MSETSLILAAPAPGTRPAALERPRHNSLNALEAIERGFALFRSTFGRLAWRYYVGTAPLAFVSLALWIVDGKIRFSDGALLLEAVILAGAYALRVWTVSGYVQAVREHAFGVLWPRLSGVSPQVAAIGRVLAWNIILSAAALAASPSIVGAVWFYSASQFANLEARDASFERHSLGGCLALAGEWFGGSVLLFLMFLPLWIAAWLNALILTMALPQLLHSIFGVNTLLSTQAGVRELLLSSALWLSLFGGAWLALDPVVKCTFVIVYQHLKSRREGDDMRGILVSLPRVRQKKTELLASSGTRRAVVIGSLVLLSAILFGVSQQAGAQSGQAIPSPNNPGISASESARQARTKKLSTALNEESQRVVYRWHDVAHPDAPNWLDRLFAKIGSALKAIGNAIAKLLRWLWPRALNLSPGSRTRGGLKNITAWLALVAVLTLAAGGFLIWRRSRFERGRDSGPVSSIPLPDLSNTVLATEHSEDEWFALADQLEGQGELRLALRAAYLGLLAGLAQREWLTIRRDRTNREYLDEFTRRWRRRPTASFQSRSEIPEKLRSSLRLFDHVWYGFYALTPTVVAAYRQDQRELLSNV